MRPHRVLVTGVSRYLGGRLAALLAADPGIEQIVGVDVVPPKADLGRTQFVRADIRNPLIAKVLAAAEIDTVVHLNVVATPVSVGGRAAMKEINVIGTMQLLAACQRAPSVRRLVVKSTTAVYGTSPRDPTGFTEDEEPRRLPRGGYAKDSVEVEGYVRGFARRRPDVSLTLLRFTNFLGPTIETTFSRYFALPAVPTVFGFDPRLQFCHEDDGIEVLRRATLEDHPGTFNVGGPGVLFLSQALRRAGRLPVPVVAQSVNLTGGVLRRAGLVDFSPEQLDFLQHGRVVSVHRLIETFGYTPKFSTEETFDDFVRSHDRPRVYTPAQVDAAAAAMRRLIESNGAAAGSIATGALSSAVSSLASSAASSLASAVVGRVVGAGNSANWRRPENA